MSGTIYLGTTNVIEWDGLKSAATGHYLSDATLTFSLYAADWSQVAGPITMDYVAGTDGRYQGYLPAGTPLTEGQHYFLKLTATRSGLTTIRVISCRADYAGDS